MLELHDNINSKESTSIDMKDVKLKPNKVRIKFKIPEEDLKEDHIKGHGPGG